MPAEQSDSSVQGHKMQAWLSKNWNKDNNQKELSGNVHNSANTVPMRVKFHHARQSAEAPLMALQPAVALPA